MRTISSLLFILLFSGTSSTLNANHLLGGDITWTCNGNGSYYFYLKIYRDCGGVLGLNTIFLKSNGPVDTIPCFEISRINVTPTGSGCYTCPTPNGYFEGTEEIIYKSAEVTLNGIPPTNGWDFWYTECCRTNTTSNLVLGGTNYLTVRSSMFAFSNQNAFPCFDNSPYFNESTVIAALIGDTIQLNESASDLDGDSMSYSWANPLESSITTIFPMVPGYTFQNPFPSPIQDTLNSWTTLDSNQGIVTFNPVTQGIFSRVNQVSSYKCGQLVAAIYRESNIKLLFGSLGNGAFNKPPNFSTNHILENFNVLAGDTFIYSFLVYDFEPLPASSGGGIQTITLNARGVELGLGDTSKTIGCIIPPCATLLLPSPVTGVSFASQTLTWPTICAHIGYSIGCTQHQKSYQFMFNVKDNYCPVRGFSNKSIMVNVHGPIIQENGNNLVINYPSATFQWFLNGNPITGSTDTLHTISQSGIYSAVITTSSGCSMVSNTINKVLIGLEQIENTESSILVFPNPANSNSGINVLLKNIGTGSNLIRITDLSGKVVKQINLSISSADEHLLIDFSDLSKGHYTISLSGKSGLISTSIVLN